ncbi:hypothetical protein FHX08_005525 [Rhizobium sp. BK529]|nr:hypothetical protein [Rhizobium sp. BK529]
MSFQRKLFAASSLVILVMLVAINPFGRNLVDIRPMHSMVGNVD